MQYRNKFKLNDILISNWDYSYIPKGSTVRVVGITPTGSIKLDGIAGSYNPDKFLLSTDEDDQGELGYVVVYDDKMVSTFLYETITEAVEVANSAKPYYDLVRVYKLTDGVVVHDRFAQETKDRHLFYIVSWVDGSRIYARKNHQGENYPGTARFSGVDGDGFYNRLVSSKLRYRFFTRDQADHFTVEEAKEILEYYNDKNFVGWISTLSLEFVDTSE